VCEPSKKWKLVVFDLVSSVNAGKRVEMKEKTLRKMAWQMELEHKIAKSDKSGRISPLQGEEIFRCS